MNGLARKAVAWLQARIRGTPRTGVAYWQDRARRYGRRSVLNLGHTEQEMEAVTRRQKELLFPILHTQLLGDEETVIDFGCGPGRFTVDLARAIDGKAIGVDPIQRLLDLAPKENGVEYRLLINNRIPCADESADVVWICLVLGGLTDPEILNSGIQEIARVLRRGGLLFLVENTSEKSNSPTWHFRSARDYQELFPRTPLSPLSCYEDLGETITVMAGRKQV